MTMSHINSNNYPDAVAKIVNDYLERLGAAARHIPPDEAAELLRETDSHIYEAYHETACDDEVVRILAVLRKLGEPSGLVPGLVGVAPEQTMTAPAAPSSGWRRFVSWKVPVAMAVALFAVPVGVASAAAVAFALLAMCLALIAYYAFTGVTLVAGALFVAGGLTQVHLPGLWERLIAAGVVEMDGPLTELLGPLSIADQGLFMIVFGIVFAAVGFGMQRLGRYMVRGLRYLIAGGYESLTRVAKAARTSWRQRGTAAPLRQWEFVSER